MGPLWLKRLCLRSALFRLTSAATGLVRFAETSDVDTWHGQAVGADNVASGLELLKQLSQEHGFDVLVAVWPDFSPKRVDDVRTQN
jgi:hypothetical protein